MSGFCSFRKGKSGIACIIGWILMIAGAVILLLSVPDWLWYSVLGILLISVGFLVWRFL